MEEYEVQRGVPMVESTRSANGQARQASALDYKEIFGALTSCSIPVLDLPPVEDDLDFRHCSARDYPAIFGGIDDRDFAVSYEKLFASQDSSGVRVSSSSSSDGIIGRDLRQNKLQTGSSSNSHNAAAAAAPAADDDKTTKKNGLDDVSDIKGKQNLIHEVSSKIDIPADNGFDSFIKELGQTSSSSEDQEHFEGSSGVKSPPPQSNDQTPLQNSIEKNVNINPQSIEVTEERTTNEIIAHSAERLTFNQKSTPVSSLGGSSPSSENHRIHNQATEFHHSRSSSTTSFSSLDRIYSDDTFLKVTDINLRTKPLKLPPPRRPPPVRPSPRFYSGEMGSSYSTKPTNLDAASSVAAMKEAMEIAQARLRSAKASLEKKRESVQNRKREIGQEKRREREEEESGEWKVEEQFYELMAVPNVKVNEKSGGQLPDLVKDVRSKESGGHHSEKLETKWRASKEAFICEVGDSGVLRKPRTPKISEKLKNTLENEIRVDIDVEGEGKGEERERGDEGEATWLENQKKESGRNMWEEAERLKRNLEEEREKARQLKEEEEEKERRRLEEEEKREKERLRVLRKKEDAERRRAEDEERERRLEEEEKREKERLRILREKENAERRKAEEEERERRLEEEEKREKERLRILREKDDAERRKAEEERENRQLEEERERAKRLQEEGEREKRQREEDEEREMEKLRMLREKEEAERMKTEERERLLQEENEVREKTRLKKEEEEKDKLGILREKKDEEREVSNIKSEDERETKPEERVRGKWKIEEERMKFRKLESVIEKQQWRTEKGKEVEINEEERERRKQEEEREREREREKDRQAAERAARETNERALAEKTAAMEKSLARIRADKAAQEGKSATNPDARETPIRSRARMERHQRTVERAAKALAEKNMRDVVAQREQAERNRLAESLDAEIRRWSNGKEGNLRALLSTLQYILGPESGWQPVPLTEVLTAQGVKKAYRKATLCIHPDKLQQRGASIHHKYLCEKVFDLLKEAWSRFNSEER